MKPISPDHRPKQEAAATFYGGEVLRMKVEPGDHFVIMFQEKLPHEMIMRIQEHWKAFVGDDKAKVLILDGGAKLGVFNVEAAKKQLEEAK